MVDSKYVPKTGDLVWVSFKSNQGHEQKGRRPALVVSPEYYNDKVGLALMCPVTSKQKGYSFEVKLNSKKVKGVVLADHVRSLDWRVKEVEFIEEVSEKVIKETRDKITLLIR